MRVSLKMKKTFEGESMPGGTSECNEPKNRLWNTFNFFSSFGFVFSLKIHFKWTSLKQSLPRLKCPSKLTAKLQTIFSVYWRSFSSHFLIFNIFWLCQKWIDQIPFINLLSQGHDVQKTSFSGFHSNQENKFWNHILREKDL